jgi:hypothetical protein
MRSAEAEGSHQKSASYNVAAPEGWLTESGEGCGAKKRQIVAGGRAKQWFCERAEKLVFRADLGGCFHTFTDRGVLEPGSRSLNEWCGINRNGDSRAVALHKYLVAAPTWERGETLQLGNWRSRDTLRFCRVHLPSGGRTSMGCLERAAKD